MPFFTAPSRGYREPTVTLGTEMPIPEKRPEVLAKIVARLEEKPEGFRFNYSNGEFITSSLACARTFEGCAKVASLDTSDYTVHFDPVTKIYWRNTGCFD